MSTPTPIMSFPRPPTAWANHRPVRRRSGGAGRGADRRRCQSWSDTGARYQPACGALGHRNRPPVPWKPVVQPVIHLRAAVSRLGHFPALAGVDVDVVGGETVLLQGPNGAGK